MEPILHQLEEKARAEQLALAVAPHVSWTGQIRGVKADDTLDVCGPTVAVFHEDAPEASVSAFLPLDTPPLCQAVLANPRDPAVVVASAWMLPTPGRAPVVLVRGQFATVEQMLALTPPRP